VRPSPLYYARQRESVNKKIEHSRVRAITALEEIRRDQTGKNGRANRTRQKVQKDGVVATIEALALAKKPSDGFKWLVDADLADLTAERIVTRYPEHFSAEAFAAAQKRLAEIQNIGTADV
jgi:hypothetical protein